MCAWRRIERDNGVSYYPLIDVSERLESGFYQPDRPDRLIHMPAELDGIIDLHDDRADAVMHVARRFFASADKYKAAGFAHKAGVLLYGPPGSGKTTIARKVVSDCTAEGAIALVSGDIREIVWGVDVVTEMEPGRPVVVILEDIDNFGDSSRILSLLDGEDSRSGVLVVATTNYIDRIPPRLLRTGRFDTKIKIDFPPINVRIAYLRAKYPACDAATLAERIGPCPISDLRALCLEVLIYDNDVDTAIRNIRGTSETDY